VTIVELFRCFRHVREAGPNTGSRVESIQKWGGGQPGDSWCCWLATMVLDLWFNGFLGQDPPIPRLGSCDDVLKLARTNGWLVDMPHVGDLYLYVRGDDDAHHIGLVADVKRDEFAGISGNTSEDGLSSNGTGVFERYIRFAPHIKFVRYPRPA